MQVIKSLSIYVFTRTTRANANHQSAMHLLNPQCLAMTRLQQIEVPNVQNEKLQQQLWSMDMHSMTMLTKPPPVAALEYRLLAKPPAEWEAETTLMYHEHASHDKDRNL